jgi:hypothetical protein
MPSTAVSINGSELIANQSGADYQWLDCLNNNISIFSATSSTFSPTQSGSYAVSVSLSGCTDTSSCYTVNVTSSGINEIEDSKISLYPNPTCDYFQINIPDEFIGRYYILYDSRGREVNSGILNSNEDKIDVSKLATGTYNLKIDQINERYKLIKQ